MSCRDPHMILLEALIVSFLNELLVFVTFDRAHRYLISKVRRHLSEIVM